MAENDFYSGDVSWDAIFPDDATIKIQKKGQTAVDVTCQVSNFEDGGGGRDTESIAHFGNCFLTVTKPQEDFEVSFDADLKDTAWAQLQSNSIVAQAGSIAGSTIIVKSDGEQDLLKVSVEWKGTNGSDAYKLLYYNAREVSFEKSNAADDRLTTSVSFKLSPTNAIGSANKIEVETSALYDPDAGSPNGSYQLIEDEYDTIHGF